jgi:hypothetical protein
MDLSPPNICPKCERLQAEVDALRARFIEL